MREEKPAPKRDIIAGLSSRRSANWLRSQGSTVGYRPCGTRTTLFEPPRRATVNVYVRPRRTFTVVEEDREEPGRTDTANTRIPVDTERLKLLPATRLATVLPSSWRLTTILLPRLGSLETIRRPVDRASAVPIETAYMRVRIRRILHAEMYFDFIISSYARNGFLANVVLIDVWRDSRAERRGNNNKHNTLQA